MSSAYENCIISSQDLKMLQSVLADLGYDRHTMDEEAVLYNNAARKVIQLFQGGLTDPAELSKEMRFLLAFINMNAVNHGNRCHVTRSRGCRLFTDNGALPFMTTGHQAFKITDENNGLANDVYQATLK